MVLKKVTDKGEAIAIQDVLDFGARYGYGNLIGWLKTEWACRLRDESGFNEETAILATGVDAYPLPSKDA